MTWGEIGCWIAGAGFVAPIVAALVFHFHEFWLRPRRIPSVEIERLADDIAARHSDDPELAAFLEEEAAWFRSDDFEQGVWRKVRRCLAKRNRRSP